MKTDVNVQFTSTHWTSVMRVLDSFLGASFVS